MSGPSNLVHEVDVYRPPNAKVGVKIDEKTTGGKTVIARLSIEQEIWLVVFVASSYASRWSVTLSETSKIHFNFMTTHGN